MNYNENIGSIITDARKKKGISQNELAKRLFVTRQAVSNWENGKAFPDVSVIFKLCKILDIDIRKVVDLDKNIKIEQVIEVEKKKTNRRNLMLIGIIVLIFAAIIITLVIVLNRNQFVVYQVYLDAKEFELNDSLIVKSKVKNYFQFGTLISHIADTDENTTYNIRVYKKNDNQEKLVFEQQYRNNIYIVEDYGYGEYFDDLDSSLDNLYLEISYFDDVKHVYNYKLYVKEVFRSNSLLYLKNESIGQGELLNIEKLDENNLLKYGYTYDAKLDNFIKTMDNIKIKVYPQNNLLVYQENLEEGILNIQYFASHNRFHVTLYNADGNVIDNENYIGDSYEKNYEEAINFLKNEYQNIGGK